MQLTTQNQKQLSTISLPDFIVTSPETIEGYALSICKRFPEDEQPRIDVRYNEKEDGLDFIVYPFRNLRLTFRDDEDKPVYYICDLGRHGSIMHDLDTKNRSLLKINGEIREFTKYQYKGMKQLKPNVFTIPCTISEAEIQRRFENRLKFADLLKERNLELGSASKDNAELEESKTLKIKSGEI